MLADQMSAKKFHPKASTINKCLKTVCHGTCGFDGILWFNKFLIDFPVDFLIDFLIEYFIVF